MSLFALSQPEKALPYRARILKDQANSGLVVSLGLIELGFGFRRLQFVARLLSFRSAVFDAIFLRALFFFNARLGFAKLV